MTVTNRTGDLEDNAVAAIHRLSDRLFDLETENSRLREKVRNLEERLEGNRERV